MGDVKNIDENIQYTTWELRAPDAKWDLVVKKVAVCAVAILNLAALGAVLYYIIAYTSVPSQALLISPFVVGVLIALANLKFPTFGLSARNYTDYLNPASMIGRGLAYLFFGPLVYTVERIDWTPYHDPFKANKISNDLEKLSFEKIADEYGENFDNLIAYGFLPFNEKEGFMELYELYEPLKKEIAFYKKEGLEECQESVEAKDAIKLLETKWGNLREKFLDQLPRPDMPKYNFSEFSTDVSLQVRDFCHNGPQFTLSDGDGFQATTRPTRP